MTEELKQKIQSEMSQAFEGRTFPVRSGMYESAQRWAKPVFETNGLKYKGWGVSETHYTFVAQYSEVDRTKCSFEVDGNGQISNWKWDWSNIETNVR